MFDESTHATTRSLGWWYMPPSSTPCATTPWKGRRKTTSSAEGYCTALDCGFITHLCSQQSSGSSASYTYAVHSWIHCTANLLALELTGGGSNELHTFATFVNFDIYVKIYILNILCYSFLLRSEETPNAKVDYVSF